MPEIEDARCLELALDAEYVTSALRDVSAGNGSATRRVTAVEVVRTKALHRALVYSLGAEGEGTGSIAPRLMGKLYSKRNKAEESYRNTTELIASIKAVDAVATTFPAPVAFVPGIGLYLQEMIEAPDLRAFVDTDSCAPAMRGAARWLATFHRATPTPSLAPTTRETEIASMQAWLSKLKDTIGSEVGDRLDAQLQATDKLLPPAREGHMIHGDFYAANVLWDGHNAWGIDLDRVRIGDPARDVGCFLAQLTAYSFHASGRLDNYNMAGKAFLDAYEAAAETSVKAALPFYRAYTFLQVAMSDFQRERPSANVSKFAELAVRELDALTASSTA